MSKWIFFDEIKRYYDLDSGQKADYYPLQYDNDYGLFDSEIIGNKFPFTFLNLYCNNWQRYLIINLHLEEVVNFIENAKKMNVTRQKSLEHVASSKQIIIISIWYI